jgi:hypothetical protein
MTPDEFRFTFMTFVFSVTLGLIISVFEPGPTGFHYFALKFGYAIPALLLMVDMWLHYNRYYQDKHHPRTYGERALFLDTVLLALMYGALSGLKATPLDTDPTFGLYPPRSFWIWMLAYSVVKIVRAWGITHKAGKVSWYTLLHVLLLALILGGWGWQTCRLPVPLPFWSSGAVFSLIVMIYLYLVYARNHDPLEPIGDT